MPNELQELLTDQLRDIYDAEKQITKALPKVAKAAEHPELQNALREHLKLTQTQIQRLEQVFEMLGEKARSKPCKGMRGLVEENQEHISEGDFEGPLMDQVIIGGAQKVEHYEIAAYGTARALANAAGLREVAQLLDQTAKEEGDTDKLLTQIAKTIMKETGKASRSGQQAEEEMEGPRGRSGGGMASRAKKTAGTRAGAGRQSLRQSGTSGARGSGRSSGNVMTDHEEIRQWAEERGAKPACVRGTGGKSDTGLIRLDFPGYSGGDSLEEISWDEWFAKFDEQNLALLYQDKTARGQKSNFNKLVSRETAASGQTRKARR